MNEDLARTLHPPRLPEAFAAAAGADFLAAFGMGLILAALILALAMPLLRRRTPRQGQRRALRARLTAAASLPAAERSLALARIAGGMGRALPPDLQAALYSRAGADPARIEALIRQPPGGKLSRRKFPGSKFSCGKFSLCPGSARPEAARPEAGRTDTGRTDTGRTEAGGMNRESQDIAGAEGGRP